MSSHGRGSINAFESWRAACSPLAAESSGRSRSPTAQRLRRRRLTAKTAQQQPGTCTTTDDRRRGVPKGRSYESPGPGDASAASNAAALGAVVGRFPSHNVAALNPLAMGATRDTHPRDTRDEGRPVGTCGTFRNSTQGRVNARSARIDLPWALLGSSRRDEHHSPTTQPKENLRILLLTLSPRFAASQFCSCTPWEAIAGWPILVFFRQVVKEMGPDCVIMGVRRVWPSCDPGEKRGSRFRPRGQAQPV